MKKKYVSLLLSAMIITTGVFSGKSMDVKSDEGVKNKTIASTELKIKKPETATLKPDNTEVNEKQRESGKEKPNQTERILQEDLIEKNTEESTNDSKHVDNPNKSLSEYKGSENEKEESSEELISKEEIVYEEQTSPEWVAENKTVIVGTEDYVGKEQYIEPAPTNNRYAPNSITYNGSSVNFQPSEFNYFVNEDASWDELDRRYNVVTDEIRKTNISLGPAFSGTDGQTNYILGHNPGSMSGIATLEVGSIIYVTDAAGNTFEYQVVDHADTSRSYDFIYGNGYCANPFYYGWSCESVFIQYCVGGESQVFLALPTE